MSRCLAYWWPFLAICMIALILPIQVSAGPVVTSASISDGVLTIIGTGFGTKDPAPPLIWDDFESGTVGGLVTDGTPAAGVKTWNTGTWKPRYAADEAWAGNQSAKTIFETSSLGSLWIKIVDDGLADADSMLAPRRAFLSGKYRFEDSTAPPCYLSNIKIARLTANYGGDPPHGYPNIKTGTDFGALNYEMSYANGGKEYLGTLTPPANPWNEGWHSLQFAIRFCYVPAGLTDTFNPAMEDSGYAGERYDGTLYEDNPVTWVQQEWDDQDEVHHYQYYDMQGLCTAMFSYYWHRSYPHTAYWDNCYVDSCLSRVEISVASGSREMQPPLTWSDTEITCTWNPGIYDDETNVDLFVYDNYNNNPGAYDFAVATQTPVVASYEFNSWENKWRVVETTITHPARLRYGIFSATTSAIVDSTDWSDVSTFVDYLYSTAGVIDSTYTLGYELDPDPIIGGYVTEWIALPGEYTLTAADVHGRYDKDTGIDVEIGD